MCETTAERPLTMAAKKGRQKRLEQLPDSEGDFPVRRSPRLFGRYAPRERIFPLAASSRPSLPSYEKEKMKTVNILNESGQSVPASFEDEEETEVLKVSHDHTYAQKSGDASGPAHLYGLDDSDVEQMPTAEVEKRKYRVFDTERTLRSPTRQPTSQQPRLNLGKVMRWIRGVAYKIVSLVYLVASALLCLDVIALHKMSKHIHQRQPIDSARIKRSWFTVLMLLMTLVLLLVLLSGGNFFYSHPEPVEELIAALPSAIGEGEEKLAQLVKKLNETFFSHVGNYLSNFREQLVVHLEAQAERLVSAREFNRWFELKNQLSDEAKVRELAFNDMKTQLLQAIEESVASLASSVARNMSELDSHIKGMQKSSEDYKAQLNVTVSDSAKATKEHQEAAMESARDAWLNEALQRFQVELEKFREKMKNELDIILQGKDALNKQQYDDLKPLLSTSAIMASRLEQLERRVQAHLQSNNTTDYSSVVAIVHEELRSLLKNHSSWLHPILSDSVTASKFGNELGARIAQLESATSRDVSDTSELSVPKVKQLVRESLARYSADRIAKFDFALENAGGTVVIKHCSPTYAPSQSSVSLFGVPLYYFKNAPNAIIQPQVHPGDCWAFEGSKGHAVIKLVTKAFITGVTLEHVPKELSLNQSRTSSPKDFSVWGLHGEDDEGKLLGTFTYSLDNEPIQEFPISDPQDSYTHVKFQFLSNNGNPDYTCVYRVRVHGYLPVSQ